MSYKSIKPFIMLIFLLSQLVFAQSSSKLNIFEVNEEPKNLGKIVNSTHTEFSPTISPDGSFLIFHSNREGKYRSLYISYFKDGKWTSPKKMNTVNSQYNDEGPYLSADGKILLFSSDRDGSMEMTKNKYGQIKVSFDIYWSKHVNGKWTKPEPIPGQINTILHEKNPTISKDGKVIYYNISEFGNNKWNISARAFYKNGQFKNPEKLPKPFNQGNFDVAIIPAEDLNGLFFSSNRTGGEGGWDLYFTRNENGKYSKAINLGNKINSKYDEVFLSRVDQRYFICSNKDSKSKDFDIYSAFIFGEEKFETRAILFDYNSDVIKIESFEYLNALAKYLKNNPNLNIEIIGHTDLHGSDKFNIKLSLKRADSVKKYLVKTGISSKNIKIKGEGKQKPIVNKIGDEFDKQNRRTEFKITKK